MKWARSLFARAITQPAEPQASRLFWFRRSASGVMVTPDTALQDATVWACVSYLTRAVGQLPWRVMVESASGGLELATGRDATEIDWLIHHRPSPDMGSFTWRESMLGCALLWGNAYAEIERNVRGTPIALWPIHPDRVAVKRNENGRLEYEVWNNFAGRVVLQAEAVFHVRGFGDGPVGYNVVEYAAESIGWARATQLFGSTFFGEGMNPSGIVESPNALSPEGLGSLRASFKELYNGPKGERTMFLDAGMKFQRLSTTPEDSQFIETRQHQIEEICRWFGVPPHKVMHLLRATFSNIEHQSIEVVVDSVTPWVKRFEEEANYKLFGANRGQFRTKMNLNGLMRGDSASRAAFYTALFNVGALSVNDILRLENMNPIGKDGDKRFVPLNMTTLEKAGTEPVAPAPAPADDDDTLPPKPNGADNGRRLPN